MTVHPFLKSVLLLACVLILMTALARSQLRSPTDFKMVCELQDDRILESSGLVQSIRNRNCYWTHNDSGDTARLFLFDSQGRTRCTLEIESAQAIDWEDLAIVSVQDKSYLAIGDIGGNSVRRDSITIYLVQEPICDDQKKEQRLRAPISIAIDVTIPGGVTDFESLAWDPLNSVALLVEKSFLGGRVFQIPFDLNQPKQSLEAKPIGQAPISLASACDISRDGSRLAILTYAFAYIYDRSVENPSSPQSWDQALLGRPLKIPLPKLTQAEALCFSDDGLSLLVTSERRPTPLVQIELPQRN